MPETFLLESLNDTSLLTVAEVNELLFWSNEAFPTLKGAGMNAAPPTWASPMCVLNEKRNTSLDCFRHHGSLLEQQLETSSYFLNHSSPRECSDSNLGPNFDSTLFRDSQQSEDANSNDFPAVVCTYPQFGAMRDHLIRCDVETVKSVSLNEKFCVENCIYRKAMLPPSQYSGRRLEYERTANELGWRLAYLNPNIRGHRGLIQRAVDCYRNSSHDPSLHSRRYRRSHRTPPLNGDSQ